MKNHSFILVLGLALAAACTGDPEGDTRAADGGGGAAPSLDPLYQCDETDFQVLLPLVGSGVGEDGALLALDQESYVLHTTQLVVRPGAEQDALSASVRVAAEAASLPGLVAMTAAGSEGCGYLRTYGIWRDEEAIMSLLATSSHAEAASRTAELALSTKLVSWSATRAEAEAFGWEAARAKAAESDATSYE
jgi:hypothetical protein